MSSRSANVKGILFADYVRMVRRHKAVVWELYLGPEEMAYVKARIDPDTWYPMAVFERLGNAILKEIGHGDLTAVRMWGRLSVDQLVAANPTLLAMRDPVESLTRFRILRSTFFDFDALQVPLLHEDEAWVTMSYGMGMPAEEAACHQTLGFFERLLELTGATNVAAEFRERSWAGDARTRLELGWQMSPSRR